jgi:DNA polymerase-3 subunit gamma/tau
MSYTSLYRKYRPQNFEQIVGQQAIVTTLKNQIENGEIGHAYLFCGMRGTGKTTTARVFSKALNCEKGPTSKPCNKCHTCRSINAGSLMDVIEMDAASNRGIDDIRDLREKVNFPPAEGRYKIYIIDEVHMLTTEAFNALLKTLEEPPKYVVFILATTEPNKLLPTILSRCMRFDFTRVSARDIVKRMREIIDDRGAKADEKALAEIAANSQGSVRDALSLLEKAIAFGGEDLSHDDVLNLLGAVSRDVFYDISRAVLQKDCTMILNIVDTIAAQGKDLLRFSSDLQKHFRNILMACIGADRNLIDVMDEEYEIIKNVSQGFTRQSLLVIIEILKVAENDIKWSSQPRILIEAALVKLTIPSLWEGMDGYISRIDELEKRVEALEGKFCGNETHAEATACQRDSVALNRQMLEHSKPDKREGAENYSQNIMVEQEQGEQEEQIETDSESTLQKIRHMWPDVIQELGENKKKRLQVIIDEGEVFPVRVDRKKLYLCCEKGDFFKEIIETEKNIIERAIKNVTGLDLYIKGFENTDDKSVLQEQDAYEQSSSNPYSDGDDKEDINSNEEFSEKVTAIFGKDIVQIEKDKKL